MSNIAIRAALETKLKELSPDFATSWENNNFRTADGGPWQTPWLMLARPENPTYGDDFYRQRGYLQIDLKFPQNKGAGPAGLRAKLLRDSFKRGLSVVADGVTTIVEETPEIAPGSYEDDRYVVRVFIRFYANVQPTE